MKLVLENKDGKTIRTFNVDAETAFVVNRKDTRRVEVHVSLALLESRQVKFETLGEVKREALASAPMSIGEDSRLRLVGADAAGAPLQTDTALEADSERSWRVSLGTIAVLMVAFLVFVLNRPEETAKLEEKIKQQVVQIVRQMPKPKTEQPKTVQQDQPETKQIVKKTTAIKRMGALKILGSLSSSKQKGGLNLGAVNTTAGPGLGGTQGSGGTQTTLYGKGLVAAPLGAGQNLQGGGGYGTKGKGGGQAGYGSMQLVGSAGTAPIPLGREAIIEGGLDRDLINDVIRRNMGQIRFCYEQGLQGDPSLAGRVAIAFTIGDSGQVKVAGVDSTTLNSKVVEDCIVLRLRSWKFPLPQGGADVKVSYPFVLRRAGQG